MRKGKVQANKVYVPLIVRVVDVTRIDSGRGYLFG